MEQIDLVSRIDKGSFLKNRANFDVSYNTERDILFLQLKNPPPAISVDCGGLFWLRVNPDSGEIVGVEVEGYRKVFLKKYKEFERMSPSNNKPFVDRLSQEVAACLS